jgi:hypothetical protein
MALGLAQCIVCAITVAIAAINVLWILMAGSVAATLGLMVILVLETPPWFERRGTSVLPIGSPQLAIAGEIGSEPGSASAAHV